MHTRRAKLVFVAVPPYSEIKAAQRVNRVRGARSPWAAPEDIVLFSDLAGRVPTTFRRSSTSSARIRYVSVKSESSRDPG